MIKKLWVVSLMCLLLMCGLAAAATVVTLKTPGNATVVNNPFSPTFNVTGNQSTWACSLYDDGGGSWAIRETDSGVTNNSDSSFSTVTLSEAVGGGYNWDVICNATTDPVGDWGVGSNTTEASGNAVFGVDDTDPVFTTTNLPADLSWDTDRYVILQGLVTDNNPNTCILTSTMNYSSNLTKTLSADTAQAYSNATAFNFTGFDKATGYFADNNTGAYTFSIVCTDDAANSVTVSSRTLFVDSTAPAGGIAFDATNFRTDNLYLWNATTATDYTPQLAWNETVELNFSRYEIKMYYNSSLVFAKNVTTKSVIATNMTELQGDIDPYYINITAFDLAGNSLDITNQAGYEYSTDSTNRALDTGWNIIGNTGNACNLSNLLSWTGGTTVSLWNSTHEWVSHVSGGSNGGESFASGGTALVYVSADTNFGDIIWNATAVAPGTATYLLNSSDSGSNSGWNLLMQKNSTSTYTMNQLDVYLNCDTVGAGCTAGSNNASNVGYFSVYDNTASAGSKYVPVKANWSINNDTTIGYGNTFWAFVDQNVTLTWTGV